MFYKVDFACDDREDLQIKLNQLYNYKDNLSTKVMHRNRINLFCTLMEELIKHNAVDSFQTAIDIGCNAGAYAKIISDFGFRYVVGIDVVDEMIDKANDFFAFSEDERTLEFKVLNAEDLDPNKKFDFVLCTEVIEHVENPTTVIEKIQSILTPKGVGIVSLPNRISLPYFLLSLTRKMGRKRYDHILQQHLNYPFYRSIRLFKGNNIRVVKTSGTNLLLGGILLRVLYKTPAFATVNRINFQLSRLWPLKFFTQFFFIVIKNEGTS
jgi:SAM-dependent methyltransferase